MNHRIVITDPLRVRAMILYARQHRCEESLGMALIRLLEVATIGMMKSYSGSEAHDPKFELEPTDVPITAVIGADHAPMSLGFALFRGADTPQVPSGKFDVTWAGGFIYEGPRQPLNGSAPALTVNIGGDSSQHSWSVHT